VHPTLCPNDAARHTDAIVVGNAEGVWPLQQHTAKDMGPKGFFEMACSMD
jgi:hypothetical protein